MKNIFDKTLSSDRLYFRRISLLDVDDMFEYTSNKENINFLSWDEHKTKEQVIKFIKNTLIEYNESDSRYTWGIELKENKKLIGAISIFNIGYQSKRVEVSYILNQSFQGKGYMYEALISIIDFIMNDLNYIRVQAKCTVDNLPSEKVMKKVNMKYEGKLMKYWKIKEEFKNVLLYAIVK